MTACTPPTPWHPESLLPPARDASDRPLLWGALVAAGLLHLGALCLPLPPARGIEVPETPQGPMISLTEMEIPPPSTPEPAAAPPRESVRRIPVPTPDPPRLDPVDEPVRAPVPPMEFAAPPVWFDARPAAPPPEPMLVDEWTPGVERPVALPGRIQPAYPEAARRAKLEGVVVLRALITRLGDVESIELVRETRPGLGFAAAAAEAVSTWKYRPGRLNGRPVAVVLTVVVEFKLR